MTCAMRPGVRARQGHRANGTAVPLAGDHRHGRRLCADHGAARGLPTVNFRVDYLRPAVKTGSRHHRQGAARRQERRRGPMSTCFNEQKALLAVGRATYSTLPA
jgi:hypothetical protein